MSKIILIGEHAVIYGYKAIAMPIKNRKVNITVKKSKKLFNSNDKYLNKLVYKILKKIGKKPYIKLRIINEIPQKKGLGSSASFAIEVIRKIYNFYNKNINDYDIYSLAKSYEDEIHNPSSGLDILTSLSDKPIIFQKNEKVEKIEFNLNSKIYILDTLEKGKTKKAIELVRNNYHINEEIIKKIGEKTEEFISSKNDLKQIAKIFNETNELLEEMDLVSNKAKKIIEICKPYVDGIKISGSGLGGIVIAILENNKEKEFLKILKENKIKILGIENI